MAHTPGPWAVSDESVLSEKLNEYGNWIVCDCRREVTEQDRANLRLIAAAPDLLEACKMFRQIGVHHKWRQEFPELWAAMQSAVSKAISAPVTA